MNKREEIMAILRTRDTFRESYYESAGRIEKLYEEGKIVGWVNVYSSTVDGSVWIESGPNKNILEGIGPTKQGYIATLPIRIPHKSPGIPDSSCDGICDDCTHTGPCKEADSQETVAREDQLDQRIRQLEERVGKLESKQAVYGPVKRPERSPGAGGNDYG